MKKITLSMLTLATLLSACGGGGGGGTGNGGGDGGNGGTGNTALQTKLAACPVLSQSSDPSASACLTGTYTGTNPAGAACSFTIRADGSYDFTSPTLTYSYTPTAKSFRLFDHSSLQGAHQVLWSMNDPIQTVTSYEVDFIARFGTGFTGALSKIEIKAEKINPDSSRVNATCVVPL
ncbi:hypothetical protein [Deinococcus fonticola]|uniref:hypothetical protein n=1 Tax=Deinococcus fonticola TaxID=2528713 RepID=UPI001074C588|nr:hypothetical protein [Deinococcus fonticola]